jgi:hypothetical protein
VTNVDMITAIIEAVSEFLPSTESTQLWLRAPNRWLGNDTPIQRVEAGLGGQVLGLIETWRESARDLPADQAALFG